MEKLRCSIGYEEMENDFYRYRFAVPVSDAEVGYQLYNSSAFECTIEGEEKIINVVALEAFTIAEVEYDGEKLPSLAFGFVGLKPMTREEFDIMQKEQEEAMAEMELQKEMEDKMEWERLASVGCEDAEFEDIESDEEPLPLSIDLTGK